MSQLEIFGVVCGVTSMVLAVRQNSLCWPIGLFNNVVLSVVFWRSGVYAYACLQLITIAVAVYGWWQWRRIGNRRLVVRRASARLLFEVGAGTLVAWGAIFQLLARYSNSRVPALDSWVTSLALAAQFLAGRKLLENWLVWLAVDSLAVCLALTKHLYVLLLLYAAYLLMCLAGYWRWRKLWAEGDC